MPAAIGAFVVAVGGWGAAIALVLSIAVSAYSVIALKRAQAGSQQERKQILRSATAPFNVIYGKNRSAGTLTFAEEAYLMEVNEQGQEYRGKTEVLFMVVTHAGHPLHKVEGYKLNDDDYNRLSPNQALIQTYKDGAEVSEPMLLKHSPSWRADMVGKGIAWFVARLQFDQNLFPNGVPNINALKWGYEIEDPRTGLIQWTDNPALVMLHYLKTYLGYGNDELIIETFISAANISDEWVSLPEGAGQEARYRIGAEFNIDEEPSSILDKMLATMGGEWVKVGGRLGLAVAAYYGPAVIDITEDDLIDAVELQPEVERQDAFNTVRGKFNDAAQDYIETDYPQVSVAEYLTEDGEEIISSLDLEFVQSPWQCQRLAHIAIQRNRYGMQVKLPCNLRGFKCVPGTVINLRLPGIGLDGVECRVLDWEFSLDNGVVLVVRRESAAMYNDAVGRPLELPPLISSTNEVAAPTNLRFETDVNNDTVSGSLHWSNSAMQLSHTVIKIKAGETVVQTVQVPSPGESIAVVGLAAGNYSLSAIAVAVSGRASPETALNITLAHPVAPSHADVDVSSEGLTIMPHIGDDSQLSINTIFEFYFNVIDDLAGAQRLGQGKMLTKQGLAPDTQYWFWIYTITPLGRSAAPLGIVTRTGLVSGDILDHIDNQVSQKVAEATEELLRDMGSLTDIRGIAEDLDAQILADYIAQGLSELDAQQAAKRVARLMESVTLLSDDQQSLAQTVTSLYARFDENAALVQQKDRAQVGYAIKKNGSPGDATSPAAAEMFGETWIPGRALADSVKLVGIVTESGKTLTVSQYFSALETASGELKARAFLGIDANGRTTGIGITSDETGETVFQAINFIGDAVSISSPDNPAEALLYYDTQNKMLVVKGRMILGDGYVIDSEEAIRAKDGGRWETRYKLNPNSPETPTGRHPVGWGTAMPNPSNATQIIWASTAFINADDTLSITWAIPARISGVSGNDGVGVAGVVNFYQKSASSTIAPTTWGTEVPELDQTNKYLWNYEKITYSNGSNTTTAPAMIGTLAADGKGIVSITEYYLASAASSGVTTLTSGWTTTPQATDQTNKYLWNYEIIKYTSGQDTVTTPAIIGTQGANGANGANGFSGAGFYRLINSNGIWPGDGAANGLFYTAFGRYPVIDDVLTFYSQSGATYTTKRCTNAGNGSTATWAAAALLLHGDMIALGTISGSRLIAGTEISAPFIRGGQIEIGGANGTFAVDVNGGVLIRSAGTNAHLEIINDRLQVYDDTGVLAVRIGRL